MQLFVLEVEEAVDATGTEKPKESSVLIQPVTSSPPPQSSTKHTKITLAEPEVPVGKFRLTFFYMSVTIQLVLFEPLQRNPRSRL